MLFELYRYQFVFLPCFIFCYLHLCADFGGKKLAKYCQNRAIGHKNREQKLPRRERTDLSPRARHLCVQACKSHEKPHRKLRKSTPNAVQIHAENNEKSTKNCTNLRKRHETPHREPCETVLDVTQKSTVGCARPHRKPSKQYRKPCKIALKTTKSSRNCTKNS